MKFLHSSFFTLLFIVENIWPRPHTHCPGEVTVQSGGGVRRDGPSVLVLQPGGGRGEGQGPGEGDAAVSEDDTVDTMMRTEIRCT